MSGKEDYETTDSYYKKSERVPYQKQNEDYPGFDIAKNLKGTLPRDEVKQLFSVRVTNIQDVVKSDILDFFKDYDVADIHIPWEFGRKTEDGKPVLKGYAFVRFREEKFAEDAVKNLDNTELKGMTVGIQRTFEYLNKKPFYNREGAPYHNKGYDRGSGYRPSYRKPRYQEGGNGGYRENRSYPQDDYYTDHNVGRGPEGYSRPAPYEGRGGYRPGPPMGRYPPGPYQKRGREPAPYDNYERRDYRPRPYDGPPSGYPRQEYNSYPPNEREYRGGGYPPSEGKRRRFNNYDGNNRVGYQNDRSYPPREQGYNNSQSYGYNSKPYNNSEGPAASSRGGGYERRGPKPYQTTRSEKRF